MHAETYESEGRRVVETFYDDTQRTAKITYLDDEVRYGRERGPAVIEYQPEGHTSRLVNFGRTNMGDWDPHEIIYWPNGLPRYVSYLREEPEYALRELTFYPGGELSCDTLTINGEVVHKRRYRSGIVDLFSPASTPGGLWKAPVTYLDDPPHLWWRARREAVGMSQEAFARYLGVSQATIAQWESGKRRPREPWTINSALEALEMECARLAHSAAERVESGQSVHVWASDAEYWENDPQAAEKKIPASLYRVAVARAFSA